MDGLENEDESLFYNTFKKKLVSFFKQEQAKGISKQKVMKDECQLFSRLCIAYQNTQCDLQEFFKHENQSNLASLSDTGKLHTCKKSQLVEILEAQVNISDREPKGDAISTYQCLTST